MRASLARYLLLIGLFVSGASAQEGKIIQLKQPVIGCRNVTDLRQFPAVLPTDFPESKKPLEYLQGRCIRLAPGRVRIERVQNTYACVAAGRRSCLWARSEDAGVPIFGDDGFRPSSRGPERAAPFFRSEPNAPEPTPSR
jgi:hypothetical protein